jgi:hypothetical protein
MKAALSGPEKAAFMFIPGLTIFKSSPFPKAQADSGGAKRSSSF